MTSCSKSSSSASTGIYSRPFGFQNLERNFTDLLNWDAIRKHKKCSTTAESFYAEKIHNSSSSPLNIPEFVGPIDLKLPENYNNFHSRGRGIIAIQNIKAGQLIIVSKALALVQCVSNNELQSFKLLRESIANLIQNYRESIARSVYELWAGTKLEYLRSDDFSTPLPKPLVHPERIERICTLNAFENRQGRTYGLWWLPSFLNHDCYGAANAHWKIVQNYMIVRAAVDISEGTEILISYIDPNTEWRKRSRFYYKHEFICECTLCKIERREGPEIRKQRDRLIEDFEFLKARGRLKDPQEIEENFIQPLKLIRAEDPELNVFLIQPLVELGLLYYENKKYDLALEPLQHAYNLSEKLAQFGGFRLSIGMTIVTILSRCDCVEKDIWLEKVKVAAIIEYGTVNMLKVIRPSFYNEFIATDSQNPASGQK